MVPKIQQRKIDTYNVDYDVASKRVTDPAMLLTATEPTEIINIENEAKRHTRKTRNNIMMTETIKDIENAPPKGWRTA